MRRVKAERGRASSRFQWGGVGAGGTCGGRCRRERGGARPRTIARYIRIACTCVCSYFLNNLKRRNQYFSSFHVQTDYF